jgi:hypothetical protein
LLQFGDFSSHTALTTPLASPTGPRGIACNSKGWHTRRHQGTGTKFVRIL